MTELEALIHGRRARRRKPQGRDTATRACHSRALPSPPSLSHNNTRLHTKVFVYVKILANVTLVNTELTTYHSRRTLALGTTED